MSQPTSTAKDSNRGPRRIAREKRTVEAMLRIYCGARHGAAGQPGAAEQLCTECAELLDYAYDRLDRCPFGALKPTCANCPIHCYLPATRTRMQAVMRYAGPRMILRHPSLALLHLLDGRRRSPCSPEDKPANPSS